MAAARRKDPWPPDVMAELEAGLSKGLARAYVLRGEERYFREKAIEAVTRIALAQGHELVRHDGNDPELSVPRLIDDLTAAPMFSAARCVVVRDPEAAKAPHPKLLDKRDDGSPSAFTRAVQGFLADAGRGGCVVISTKSMRADHAIAKAVKQAGGPVLSFRRLYDSPPPWEQNPDPTRTELARWLHSRARAAGVRLSLQDAAYVAAATGNDLSALDTQLDKLRHGGGAALREIVGWDSAQAPWKLSDPLLLGDLSKSISGLEALFAAGFESSGKRESDPAALANVLLGTLRNQLRQTIAGARALAAGQAPAAAAAAAGLKGGKTALEAFEKRLRARPPAEWERMFEDLGELERRTRTAAKVDVSDFVDLALRWRREQPREPRGAPAGRRR